MTPEDIRAWVYDEVTTQRVRTTTEGAWLRMECPECEERGKTQGDTFGVNIVEGWFHCFRCGVRGSCPEIVDDTLVLVATEQKPPDKPGLPEGFMPLLGNETHIDGRVVLKYLRDRGFPKQTLDEAMVGFTPSGRSRYAYRAVIPVWTWDNWLAGFSARYVPGLAPGNHIVVGKYLYPKGMDRNDLYLAEELRVETNEPVLLVEGVLDALAYWPNAVACLGKPTPGQLWSVGLALRRPIVVALDKDARRESMKAAAELRRMTEFPVGMFDWQRNHRLGENFTDIGSMVRNPHLIRKRAMLSF